MVTDYIIDSGGESPLTLLEGKNDIIIQGLTGGSVKLQYLLTTTDELPTPEWTDHPDGYFTEDTFTTLFVSEHGVYFKLVGVNNNSGVYVRLSGNPFGGGEPGGQIIWSLDFSKYYNSFYIGAF